MNSPAVFQIPDHCNCEAVYSPEFVSDRENVEQRLRRMFTNSVTCVYQRFSTVQRCFLKIIIIDRIQIYEKKNVFFMSLSYYISQYSQLPRLALDVGAQQHLHILP